jgi:phosphoenolpyruvate phosphomutase
MTSQSKILKEKIERNSIVKVAGAFDALSAKLVEIAGFDAVWASSFGISATHALPDAGIMTMTEFLDVSSSMVESCKIPIVADCDTGFGGPSNVSHMIKKYESAGIAAVSIEDKTFPKQNSLLEDSTQELLSEKDFVAKIIAAKNARSDANFLIFARTEALIAGKGMDEAIKRANAYDEAGADAIIIHSKQKDPSEIFEFVDKWKHTKPIIVIPTSYPSVTTDELINHRIKMVIYANQSLRASFVSISKTLNELVRAKSGDQITTELSTMEDIFKVQQMYKLKSEEKSIEDHLKKLGYIN